MYSIDYFINKFEAIPQELWTVGRVYNEFTGACCALGHCGVREAESDSTFMGEWILTDESNALGEILKTVEGDSVLLESIVYRINDGIDSRYSYVRNDPDYASKTRILNALYDVRAKFNV